MQCKWRRRSEQGHGQQVGLRNGQAKGAAAQHRIGVVTGGIEGNHQVVSVIAAKEKDADQRFVIGDALGVSVEKPKTAEGRSQSQSRDRFASAFDEFPARGSHVLSDYWTI